MQARTGTLVRESSEFRIVHISHSSCLDIAPQFLIVSPDLLYSAHDFTCSCCYRHPQVCDYLSASVTRCGIHPKFHWACRLFQNLCVISCWLVNNQRRPSRIRYQFDQGLIWMCSKNFLVSLQAILLTFKKYVWPVDSGLFLAVSANSSECPRLLLSVF